MPAIAFDKASCERRNRLAALHHGVNATPLRLYPQAPDDLPGEILARFPTTLPAALDAIHGLQPAGASPLSGEEIYVHYAEAANAGLVADRYMFLAGSTLKNIAADARAGVALMNSHRTGGICTDAELPFGRTFSGAYGTEGGRQRAIIGYYMLRDLAPNGASGPTTDDVHRMIAGGTLFDVSVALYGGDYRCDVCGKGLFELDEEGGYACMHMPGTMQAMDAKQVQAQQARGVPEGRASYTYEDAHLSELSPVYDGAVPGAGIRKVLALCRAGLAPVSQLASARQAFGNLLPERLRMAADIAEDTLFPPGSTPAVIVRDSDPPAGLPFTDHLTEVLAAVRGCIQRARDIQAKRAAGGRSLGSERQDDLRGLRADLDRLLAECDGPRSRHRALQVLALRESAELDRLKLGSKHHHG